MKFRISFTGNLWLKIKTALSIRREDGWERKYKESYMRKLFILFVTINFLCIAYAQDISPLLPALTANSMLNRPDVYREMQLQIDSEIKETKPGLRLGLLYDKISIFREKLITKIESPLVSKDGDTIKISFPQYKNIKPIKISKDKLSVFTLENLKSDLIQKLDDLLNYYLLEETFEPFKKPDVVKAIYAAFIFFLNKNDFLTNELGIGEQFTNDLENPDSIKKAIKNIIKSQLDTSINKYLSSFSLEIFGKEKLSEVNLNSILLGKASNEEIDVKELQKLIDKPINKVKDNLNKVLDNAEDQITNVVNEFSRVLISGNVGLSLSEGKGNFSGGTILTVTHKKWLQTGAYINAEFNKSDTTIPTQSLLGLQVRAKPIELLQVDLLLAGYFLDKHFKNFASWEYGIGVSTKLKDYLVLGLSMFQIFAHGAVDNINNDKMFTTVGLYLKTASIKSPVLFIGNQVPEITKKRFFYDGNFGLKIIYPINGF